MYLGNGTIFAGGTSGTSAKNGPGSDLTTTDPDDFTLAIVDELSNRPPCCGVANRPAGENVAVSYDRVGL